MNTKAKEDVLYIEEKKIIHKRKKRKRLKVFNILMLFMAAYFVFTIARQELKLRDIETETLAANQQYVELKQREGVLNKQIAEASSTPMVESKAKSILGWVNENEYKVIEEQ